MKTQFIIGLFSVLLLSAIAVITGTTITTHWQPLSVDKKEANDRWLSWK